jgi:negative regulator of flagellin synthesis FlgM
MIVHNHINADRVAQQVAQLYSQRSQAIKDGSTAPEGAARSSPQDEVQLSEEARALQRLAEAVAATPDVDVARVQALRQQIEAGTYKVPIEALMSRLLDRLSDQRG